MTNRRIFSWLALWLAIAMTAAAGTALAGGNPDFTLPLHAKLSAFEPCNGYLPVDCAGVRPTVQIESGQDVAVFLLVANAPDLGAVQTAFEVDPSWVFYYGLWDCAPGLYPTSPGPPWGPTVGSIARSFDCLTRGALVPVGRMFYRAGTGCVGQVESSFPLGICVIDCDDDYDRIITTEPGQQARLGKVCVGPGGQDACEAATPVAATTWGAIKTSYP